MVAACANPKVDAIPARLRRPSEKEMAIRITKDCSTPAARIATSTPRKLVALSGSWRSTSCTNSTAATLLATVKLARLKDSFSGDCRRWIESASAVPATIDSTTTSGGAKKNPATSGSSLSEKECASRRNWRWTTNTSAAQKSGISTNQGIWRGASSARSGADDLNEKGDRDRHEQQRSERGRGVPSDPRWLAPDRRPRGVIDLVGHAQMLGDVGGNRTRRASPVAKR